MARKKPWTPEDQAASEACERRLAVIRIHGLTGRMVDMLAAGWRGERISDLPYFDLLAKKGLVARSARGFDWTETGALACANLFPEGKTHGTD